MKKYEDDIEIVLATFNGMPFIKDQIDSVIFQMEGITLLIHDDGSTDGTYEYLVDLAAKNTCVNLLNTPPQGGARANFAYLLENSKKDYIFCCDQDDLWFPEKISSMLSIMKLHEDLHGSHCPILVHSDLTLIDSSGKNIATSYWKYQNLSPNWTSELNLIMTQNIVTGCASLVNRALLSISLPIPPESPMHDHWLALYATAFGRVIPMSQPLIYYRQHSGNVVGAKSFFSIAKIKEFISRRRVNQNRDEQSSIYTQAKKFAERSGDESASAMALDFSSLQYLRGFKRLKLIKKYRFFKIGFLRNIFWVLGL